MTPRPSRGGAYWLLTLLAFPIINLVAIFDSFTWHTAWPAFLGSVGNVRRIAAVIVLGAELALLIYLLRRRRAYTRERAVTTFVLLFVMSTVVFAAFVGLLVLGFTTSSQQGS
ncbi:MAG: hypothetical protein ACLP8S_06560 [Solirubrobacteraceae bacterium]